MKILLLGANGQLGRAFLQEGGLAARGDLVAASRDGALTVPSVRAALADLSVPESLLSVLDAERPDVIVNAAAYTNVDKAETDEANAMLVNCNAVGAIGAWAAVHGAVVVHYSTDYVFDGLARLPYSPTAATAPQGAYGRSKLAGEEALRASGARHLILRTAWVYSPTGNNFMRTMLRLGTDRHELRVVADQHGTPTTANLIVTSTLAAIDRYAQADSSAEPFPFGTLHLTASGESTWHGFAEAIFEEALAAGVVARAPDVIPITTEEFPTPARRPSYSVLDNTEFAKVFSVELPHWRDGLRHTLQSISQS